MPGKDGRKECIGKRRKHSSLRGSADIFSFYGLGSQLICRRSLTIDASFSSCLYLVHLHTYTCECFCIYYDETSYMDGGHDDDKRSLKM
jgi:hypothetical protein